MNQYITETSTYANEENTAIVLALRNSFLPRLNEHQSSVFVTLLTDLWPDVDDVELYFAGGADDQGSIASSVQPTPDGSKPGSRAKTRSQMDTHRSFRGKIHNQSIEKYFY